MIRNFRRSCNSNFFKTVDSKSIWRTLRGAGVLESHISIRDVDVNEINSIFVRNLLNVQDSVIDFSLFNTMEQFASFRL